MNAPRIVRFASMLDKARWLDTAASLDSTSPRVAMLARRIVGAAHGIASLRALHRWVRDAIAYVPDRVEGMRREELADAETILVRGFDDCDGKARLFVALVRALGDPFLQARIVPIFTRHPFDFVHVQAEARAGMRWTSWPDERAPWQLAELTIAGVELGDDPTVTGRRDERGKLVLAGPSQPR